MCEEGTNGMHTSFCSLLHLLPHCLCSLELQVQSHLVAVWERGSRVLVLHNAAEPPSTAGLVISSFAGVKLVLWGVFDTCGICSDAP